MKKTTPGGFVFAFALWLCAPSTTFGQAVYGSIVGTVRDTSGASVPNAKVTVLDVAKGVAHTTATNDTGNYGQTHLIVGVYEVRIEAPSFETFVQRNVTVEVDSSTQVNAQLVIGKAGEVVNVTAEAPLLKTTRSDVSDTFTQKAVVELPVFARDINRLYFLVPGVQASSTTAASEQPQAIYRPKVGGQYWGGISFQLDGTDNRESVLGEPVVSPNIDAVSELKITTSAYDAEFGQANQAVIAAQTKSGTNEIHGGAFWFRRDNNSAARDPFSQSIPIAGTNNRFIPATLWNQFGGSLGGPIQKDKTFIFGDYQGKRQQDGGSLAAACTCRFGTHRRPERSRREHFQSLQRRPLQLQPDSGSAHAVRGQCDSVWPAISAIAESSEADPAAEYPGCVGRDSQLHRVRFGHHGQRRV